MSRYLQTKKGYDFFEASSTLQKAIRRGEEKDALYFTVELFNSGYDNYIWKRLKIMVSEDIGLAEPLMPSIIDSLYNHYLWQKKLKDKNKPERLFLIQAVVQMCRCKKSRLIDWLVVRIWREHDEVRREVPDYAYDIHTRKGKQMGRGIEHFYEQGGHLENHAEQPGERDAKYSAYNVHRRYPNKVMFDDDDLKPNNPELWQE